MNKIRDEKGMVTDFAINRGIYSETMFVISSEGNVYRRKPACVNEYAKVGALENATAERREELLNALRNANPDRVMLATGQKKTYANYKQAKQILESFNK